MTKEQRAEYNREYRKNNKEKIAEKSKEYRLNHKEKAVEYRLNHKEEAVEYNQTPNGKKSLMIGNWKRRGIKSDNYDMLYNNYLSETHCDFCRVKFGKRGDGTGTWKCCDHNHETGFFRNFLCNNCNLRRR